MNRMLFVIGFLLFAVIARAQKEVAATAEAVAVVAPNEIRLGNVEAPETAINPRVEMWDGKTTRTQALVPGEKTQVKFANLGLAPGEYTLYLVADNSKTGEPYIIGEQTIKTRDPLEQIGVSAEAIKQFEALGVDLTALRRKAVESYRATLQRQLESAQAAVIELQAAIAQVDQVPIDDLPAVKGIEAEPVKR